MKEKQVSLQHCVLFSYTHTYIDNN